MWTLKSNHAYEISKKKKKSKVNNYVINNIFKFQVFMIKKYA